MLGILMHYLVPLLLFLTDEKVNKSNATEQNIITVFFYSNIYRKFDKYLTYKLSIWLTLITMWSIRSDIFTA